MKVKKLLKKLKGTATSYHVFSDGIDDWFDDLEVALDCADDLHNKGHKNIRIYREKWDIRNNYLINEDCIFSIGSYPY